MMLPEDGYLLRIFVGERDKKEGVPLFEWLVRRAKKEKLSGATVLRGIESFGEKNQIHTAKILQLSLDLPIIIEIIDTREKIEAFLPIVDEAIEDGLATLQEVKVRLYRSKKE